MKKQIWSDEQDWLVDVVCLPKNNPVVLVVVEWLGRVYGFAMAINTRVLALIGDPEVPTYEFWYSFDTTEHKETFLDLVRHDGFANPGDEEGCFTPVPREELKDISKLRPLAEVLPAEYMLRITAIAAITAQTIMESASGKVN